MLSSVVNSPSSSNHCGCVHQYKVTFGTILYLQQGFVFRDSRVQVPGQDNFVSTNAGRHLHHACDRVQRCISGVAVMSKHSGCPTKLAQGSHNSLGWLGKWCHLLILVLRGRAFVTCPIGDLSTNAGYQLVVCLSAAVVCRTGVQCRGHLCAGSFAHCVQYL
jgi:hypothetical protein